MPACNQGSDRRDEKTGDYSELFRKSCPLLGDRHLEIFLGPERASRIDPLGSTAKRGLPFTLHSDLPITPVNPFFSMYCAVNRITAGGR
ncbi:MAG: hypothetical protein DRG59_09680 [Deltaproteobacteria bacterium]|nr:MAG: hypothetical protein DRG83_03870 [Deltaproteobacteria bacterium]RLB04905.1 MAG: hypothetical protein DRG59_09680 [Deltaproteobacteria bacterium]HEC31673.1 hypothetical protein [Deltaproteobacteria bacterium]